MNVRELVLNKLDSKDMTLYQLSKKSGVPTSTLYALKNEHKPFMTLANTVKVARVLDIDLNELKEIYGEK